jgi:hypothetical protein
VYRMYENSNIKLNKHIEGVRVRGEGEGEG